MKFLKDNIFLIGLAVIVLLGGGGLIAAYMSVSEDVEKSMAARSQLINNLTQLANGGGVNEAQVTAAEKRVGEIKGEVGKVKEACVEWNRGRFPVLQLPLGETGKVIPAFPYDEPNYRDNPLRYAFTEKYLKTLQDILTELHPTRPPTPGEVESLKMQLENQLSQQRAAVPATPSGSPGPSLAPPDVQQEAQARAIEAGTLKKASAGRIYADRTCLDYCFTAPSNEVGIPALWQAQLNLWVTRDIIDAIKATNEEVLAKKAKKDVLNSAIKRLVKININENYVLVNPANAAGAPAPVPIAAPRAMPGRGMPSQRSMLEREREDEMARQQTAAPAPGVESGGEEAQIQVDSSGQESAVGLTRRGSCKEYDVLYYSFTVIMPTRYLPILERNLLARNYHTIREVQMASPDQAISTSDTAESFYHYGSEPVMSVTLKGELLLLTPWERGTWDEEKKQFTEKFPPLVPVEVLKQQFQTPDNPALRPEDAARLTPPAAPEPS
ncbi:MAG: hypothetical protein WC869_04905 [Phycisphaerae bacterium]|jgi:hypothetical protein